MWIPRYLAVLVVWEVVVVYGVRGLEDVSSRVGLLQTAHSWANAGVLLGARVHLRVAFESINYRDEVSERRKVIVN